MLFVGTKKQAQDTIAEEAARASMPYVNQRWMGGTLTNFATILTRLRRMEDLERRKEGGEFDALPKKEAIRLTDELEKLQRMLGGLRKTYRLPDMVFIVDPHREGIAVAEANRLKLPDRRHGRHQLQPAADRLAGAIERRRHPRRAADRRQDRRRDRRRPRSSAPR